MGSHFLAEHILRQAPSMKPESGCLEFLMALNSGLRRGKDQWNKWNGWCMETTIHEDARAGGKR